MPRRARCRRISPKPMAVEAGKRSRHAGMPPDCVPLASAVLAGAELRRATGQPKAAPRYRAVAPGDIAAISRPAHPLPSQGRGRTAPRASSRPRRATGQLKAARRYRAVAPGDIAAISRPAHPLPRQGRGRTAPRASSRPRRDIAPSLTVISPRYRGLRIRCHARAEAAPRHGPAQGRAAISRRRSG